LTSDSVTSLSFSFFFTFSQLTVTVEDLKKQYLEQILEAVTSNSEMQNWALDQLQNW
jgi:hypothetical protein